MKKNILYLIFFAALIVSIVEAVYLFNYATKYSERNIPQIRSIPESTAVNATADIPSTRVKLNDAYWTYLKEFDSENIDFVGARIVCDGVIDVVHNEPGVNPADNKRFEKLLRLVQTTRYCEFVLLDEILLRSATYIDKSDGQDSEIAFEDFRVGDRIEVVTEMSLLTPTTDEEVYNLIKTTITRL